MILLRFIPLCIFTGLWFALFQWLAYTPEGAVWAREWEDPVAEILAWLVIAGIAIGGIASAFILAFTPFLLDFILGAGLAVLIGSYTGQVLFIQQGTSEAHSSLFDNSNLRSCSKAFISSATPLA